MSATGPTPAEPHRSSIRLPPPLWIFATSAGLIAVAYYLVMNLTGSRVAIDSTDGAPHDESTNSATTSEMAEYSRLFNSRNSERAARGSTATSPLSGTEAMLLKWEDLARDDRPRPEQPSGLAALASDNHVEPRTVKFANRDEVSRVFVKRVQNTLPGMPEPAPLVVVTDPEKLDVIMNFVHRHSSGWKPVPFTPPAGTAVVSFWDGSVCKGVIRLGGYGSLQGPLSADGGGNYYRNIPDDELWDFTKLLGLNLTRK